MARQVPDNEEKKNNNNKNNKKKEEHLPMVWIRPFLLLLWSSHTSLITPLVLLPWTRSTCTFEYPSFLSFWFRSKFVSLARWTAAASPLQNIRGPCKNLHRRSKSTRIVWIGWNLTSNIQPSRTLQANQRTGHKLNRTEVANFVSRPWGNNPKIPRAVLHRRWNCPCIRGLIS